MRDKLKTNKLFSKIVVIVYYSLPQSANMDNRYALKALNNAMRNRIACFSAEFKR
jgi:hypothetical protein